MIIYSIIMQNQDIYRLPGQEIEKSIIYEIPRNHNTAYNPEGPVAQRKYKVREELGKPGGSGEEFLCLNCHQYVRASEVDVHSLDHLKLI